MIPKKLMSSIPLSIRTMRRLAAESLDGTVTLQQFRVMRLIEDGMGQTEMAFNLQVSMPAISKMIQALVEKKFVERCPGKDRRCLTLKLTAKGNKIVNLVQVHVAKRFDQGLKQLSVEERNDLIKGLDLLNKFMEIMKEV